MKDKLPSNNCDEAVHEGNVGEKLINLTKDEYSDDDTKILISSFNGDGDLDQLIQHRVGDDYNNKNNYYFFLNINIFFLTFDSRINFLKFCNFF